MLAVESDRRPPRAFTGRDSAGVSAGAAVVPPGPRSGRWLHGGAAGRSRIGESRR